LESSPTQQEILAKAKDALERAKADALAAHLDVEKWRAFIGQFGKPTGAAKEHP
jgi:hypothetical protein